MKDIGRDRKSRKGLEKGALKRWGREEEI